MKLREKILECKLYFLAFLAALLFAPIILAANNSNAPARHIQVGSPAEWIPAKTILMHGPGIEVLFGLIHPHAALYEKGFDAVEAAREHKNYISLLNEYGIKVYTVQDVLLKNTLDSDNKPIAGKDLDKLRALAGEFLTIDTSKLNDEAQRDETAYKNNTLKQLSPISLVNIIFLSPTVHLYPTESNTGIAAAYKVTPLMNLYFARDQIITTKKGVVVSQFQPIQRRPETKVIRFVLAKLGIRPIYEVTGDGTLEGGDFIPAGDVAFIGQGLRTNAEGIKQLLDHKVFGTRYVAVVKDSWNKQEETHLDTYFNIINPKLAVLVDLRMRGKNGAPPKIATSVDVYELIDNEYTLVKTDLDFQSYLEKDLGFTLIPVSRKDQNRYATNFLTVAANEILAIDGVSQVYKNALKDAGVNAVWMDFHALTSGYGAAHCMTQTLFREGRPERT